MLFLSLLALIPFVASEEKIQPVDVCDPRLGIPGAVYTCPRTNFLPNPLKACEWHPPGKCLEWGDDPADRPKSLGPDPGGICAFYEDRACSTGAVK
jgi:hypothetical protein